MAVGDGRLQSSLRAAGNSWQLQSQGSQGTHVKLHGSSHWRTRDVPAGFDILPSHTGSKKCNWARQDAGEAVRKVSVMRRAICELSQGSGKVFYESWERLRDLLRQCPHHGIPKHEITQIFYHGLGAPNQYFLDSASGDAFMNKYEDEALELIELVAENSHHHATKSFGGRSAPSKGGMLDAKAVEMGMLLDKIETLTEAQNLIMDSLKIRSGFDGLALVVHNNVLPCSHCSSFEHVELDFPVMVIQGPFPFRKNPTTYPGLSQASGSHYPNQCYSNTSYYNTSYAQ